MRIIALMALVGVCLTSPAEAKTHYRLQLVPTSNQSAQWQNGIEYVDDTGANAVVRVVAVQDDLPDKQTTFRVFVLNKSQSPLTIGPSNIKIEYGDRERLPMISREELEGRLRRDLKRRTALAIIGGAFSAQAANGQTSGEFEGTTNYGTTFTGTYSGYDPALARQQQEAVRIQSQEVQQALAARQLSGRQALQSMLQMTTIPPGSSYGGVVAFDAPSSFKRLAKSGLVYVLVSIGEEEHRVAAKVYPRR